MVDHAHEFQRDQGPSPADGELPFAPQQPGPSNAVVAHEAAQVRAARDAATTSERQLVRFGSSGAAVTVLQNLLSALGAAIAVDGIFGQQTHRAVTQFQSDRGLAVDGVVGPQTWGAIETQADTTSPSPLDFAIGDAEGNGEADEARQLETLDRLGEGNEVAETTANTKGLVGFGGGPPAKDPVDDPQKAQLLAGGFADRGEYRASGDGFADAALDQLLAAYGDFWGIDVRAPAKPDDPQNKPGGGDSAGKGVHLHPPWVKAMQNAIIGKRQKWNDDDRATQKLLEAFLRAWTREINAAVPEGMPPGAEQMFHQIGASESNREANTLGGFRGAGNWCGQASSMALVVGMYNRGIRFKGGTPSSKFGPEITRQLARFSTWAKDTDHLVGGQQAWTAPVEPGDIISVVNGGSQGPLSGHVATVVKEQGSSIVYVSGNAAGVHAFEGSVRIEEVTRETPPPDYDWLTVGGRGNKYVELGQTARRENKAADAVGEEIDAKIAFIFANLTADLVGITDLNVLLQTLLASPNDFGAKAALIGNIREVLELQAKASGHRAAANAASAKRTAMENDNTGLPVNRQDRRFAQNPGKFAPVAPTSSWVVSIVKASGLTRAAMLGNKQVGLEPDDPALEKGPTLAEQCPDTPPELLNNS